MDLNLIKEKIESIVNEFNLICYSVEYIERDSTKILEVIVDKKGFVDISDITPITERINKYLDDEDPIKEEYSLEVSSRGLFKDFIFDDASYYIGEYVKIKTLDQLFLGELIEVTSDSLIIKNQKNKKIKINANDITNCEITLKF